MRRVSTWGRLRLRARGFAIRVGTLAYVLSISIIALSSHESTFALIFGNTYLTPYHTNVTNCQSRRAPYSLSFPSYNGKDAHRRPILSTIAPRVQRLRR